MGNVVAMMGGQEDVCYTCIIYTHVSGLSDIRWLNLVQYLALVKDQIRLLGF